MRFTMPRLRTAIILLGIALVIIGGVVLFIRWFSPPPPPEEVMMCERLNPETVQEFLPDEEEGCRGKFTKCGVIQRRANGAIEGVLWDECHPVDNDLNDDDDGIDWYFSWQCHDGEADLVESETCNTGAEVSNKCHTDKMRCVRGISE